MWGKLSGLKQRFSSIDFKQLIQIFLAFFKISPFTFGGGFAMIPLLEREMVDKKKWVDKEKIVDIFAVAQSVPGAIAVNSATFIGYNIAGIPGALAATLGIITPTFIIVIILALMLVSFQGNPYVQAALKGIRPTIVALIAIAAYRMGKVALKGKASWVICISAFLLLALVRNISIVLLIVCGALAGIIIKMIDWKSLRNTKSENVIAKDN